MTDYRNHSGPGDYSPPEDAPVYECQKCCIMLLIEDFQPDSYELPLCPRCGSDDVVRY